jgi:hypothetical protein
MIATEATETRAEQGLCDRLIHEVYDKFVYQLRRTLPPRQREGVATFVASLLNETIQLPPREGCLAGAHEIALARLRQDGFASLPALVTQQQVDEIVGYFGQRRCHDPWKRIEGSFLAPAAPPELNEAVYTDQDCLLAPHLVRIANDHRLLSLVEAYLGAPPTISTFTAWWSFKGRPHPKHAQLFHTDTDDFRFCKLFVYLTPVDLTGGPHVYVRGSHRADRLQEVIDRVQRASSSTRERFAVMWQSLRKADGDVVEFFGQESLCALTGPRGTSFLVDTAGVHKGQLPLSHDRLVFQVCYTLLPMRENRYAPLPPAALIDGHGADEMAFLDTPRGRYSNRLFVR